MINDGIYDKKNGFTLLEAAYIIAKEKIPADYQQATPPHTVKTVCDRFYEYLGATVEEENQSHRHLVKKFREGKLSKKKFSGGVESIRYNGVESIRNKRLFYISAFKFGLYHDDLLKCLDEVTASKDNIGEWCRIQNISSKVFRPELRELAASQTVQDTAGEKTGKLKKKLSPKQRISLNIDNIIRKYLRKNRQASYNEMHGEIIKAKNRSEKPGEKTCRNRISDIRKEMYPKKPIQ